MTQRDPGVYLEHIERYATLATRFLAGYTLEQYLGDDKTRAAVERALEICGEALHKLHSLAPDLAEGIPHYRDVIGFRNVLVHGYAEIDHVKVYGIAVSRAPELLASVREALKNFPDPTER